MEAGAEDMSQQEDVFEVVCDPNQFTAVSDALDAAEIVCQSRQVTRIPQTTVDLDVESAKKVMALIDALDDHDDVQNVSANFNLSDEVMAALSADE